jgi:hypothetical protein
MWSYVPALATVLLALLQLAKDWGAHQTTWRRAFVLALIVLLGMAGAVNTLYSSRRAAVKQMEDQKQITGLKTAVETANSDQMNNTKQFVKSFSDLSQQLSRLQAQVSTAGLQKEAAQLRSELEATQKALYPEKVELESSLDGGSAG